MNTIIVNLFGAPGAGKSTGAAYIFALLKMQGVNAELVTEFAKDKVWENSELALSNQAYLFGEQSFRMSRLVDKVDIIITDSPLMLNIIYNKVEDKNFNQYVYNISESYINLNYFLYRNKEYSEIGRIHTEEESEIIADRIRDMLNKYNIPYTYEQGNKWGYEKIAKEVFDTLQIFKARR